MEDISYYNHKYNSVESLLTKNGNINTAIVRRDWFSKLDIYKNILEKTKNIDIFENITFSDRITILSNDLKVNKCKVCGKPYVYVSKSQHMYKLCNHRFNVDHEKNRKALLKSFNTRKNQLCETLENTNLFYSDLEFKNTIEVLFNKPKNFSYVISAENLNILHDLIIKTNAVLKFDPDDMRIPERLFILKNNLKCIPKCIYCEDKTQFNNRIMGYSKTCKKHSCNLRIASRIEYNRNILLSSIDTNKYEIVCIPEILTKDNLIITCKRCGHTSEWSIKNGSLNHLNTKMLCRNCENPASKKEEGLYEFLKKIYSGEIIHHTGSRKIIPPFELDFYIPEKNLAIEFDGIYWHSENSGGKDSNYHLSKTKKCEENKIQLIHVFESEFERKYDIVCSRLKNLLGVYDNVVYARKCEVVEISNKIANEFIENNHIQGVANSSVNLGLYNDGILVSVMTFSKPRMNKKYEWELLRFCNKLGYHVVGGAGKLLKYFERKYTPRNLISYADRRWSVGNLYYALGFSFSHASRPNYWYFKLNNIMNLKNRIGFQKFKQRNILKYFDDTKTEVENMRDNGYDRIFDCGNLVFVKEY